MDLREKLSSLSISPKKVLKIVIGLSVVLLLMWLFTLSQIDYTGKSGDRKVFKSEQAIDSLSAEADTSSSEATEVSRYNNSSNLFINGLLTFFVLVVILGLIWFWADRSGGGSARSKKGRQVDNQILGEGAQLQIIRMNNEKEVWVLGVTSSSVNLLHRYTDEEWEESEKEHGKTASDTFSKLFRSKL